MKFVVLLLALAMPIVAWLSNSGVFGPDNASISDRYPTLLIADGYAFSIWGLIFLLDLAFAIWQLRGRGSTVDSLRVPAAVAFGLTALWMPVFAQQLFWLALLVIWSALAAILLAAIRASRAAGPSASARWFARLPLALHAGWLSLAVFLNTAQVIVAYGWLDTTRMLPWSAALFVLCGALLIAFNRALAGSIAFAGAAVWGLLAVHVRQSLSDLPGATTAAWIALGLAGLLIVQTVWLRHRHTTRTA